MTFFRHPTLVRRSTLALASLTALSLFAIAVRPVEAATLIQIGSDTYTNPDSQHATQVEPDSFAWGSTIVAATQSGRFTDGGSSNLNFSTSTDGGNTWTTGGLPGITKNNPAAPGPYDRVSDPSVAYNAKYNAWLVAGLALVQSGTAVNGAGVTVNRSTNGGLAWLNPVVVTNSNLGNIDKDWIVCDNTPSSPFYGNCYVEWDDNGDGNRIYMSTSTDGGQTWGPRLKPANNATGLGGQPLVQPSGTVIVPIDNANETVLMAFTSSNGGASWNSTVNVTTIRTHTVAGGLRSGPLPSAEIDGSGKVYVVWQDCRFRTQCRANDIVMTTSTNGTNWTPVTRVPIDATGSAVDHFLPGIAVDHTTSGAGTRIAIGYYYYPNRNCTASTCQLFQGYVSSASGGATWSVTAPIAGPMTLAWLANTTQGRMVGDYMSTSFVGTAALPVFALANANNGSTFNEAMYTSLGLGASRTAASVEVPMVTDPSFESESAPAPVPGGVPVNQDSTASGNADETAPTGSAASATQIVVALTAR